MKKKCKSPSMSAVETRYLVMPEHTNQYGTIFGGVILSWIDIAAAMVAQRHCGKEAVTAAIDSVHFIAPIHSGDHVIVRASINLTGKSSMEIGVRVDKENPITGETVKCTNAYLTFVALNSRKKPAPVPCIVPLTDEEKRRMENARIRMESRKELRKLIQTGE